MTTRCMVLASAFAALVAMLSGGSHPALAQATAQQVPPGFTPIFNGKDLSGWHGWAIHGKSATPDDVAKMTPEDRAKKVAEWTADAKKHWSVQNGELVNDGNGAYLATEKEYGDIELLIEYKTVAKADSGIYLRNNPQVQIWDSNQKFDALMRRLTAIAGTPWLEVTFEGLYGHTK